MLRPLLTSACLLGLAACQSPITAPPPANGTSTPRPAAQIQGRASYLERIAPPPGAILSVQLVDLQLADTPAAVIASADFRDLKGPPFAFALPYDPSKLRPNGMYGLHAGVRDAQGRLWFVTDTQVPVTPGTDAPVEFRMVRATGEPAAATSTPWQCGDQRISARFDTPARGMMLEIDGNTLHLAQAPAASGARYADAAGNAFWSKGDAATLTLAGRAAVTCRQASQDSPWDAARARGSVFRGLGTEPGWTVEIGASPTPRLLAELDYGERRIEVAQASRTEEGYVGSTAEGLAVSLTTKREACNDGMSDIRYPASATLTVGGRTYRGCGRFLTE